MNFDIFIPVFTLVFFTLLLTPRLGLSRLKAVKEGQQNPKYYRAYIGDGEAEGLAVIARHYHNLLEMPILFYLWAIIVFITGSTDTVTLSLAWAYVGLRGIHSYIHLGSNRVDKRFKAFFLSYFTLLAAWIWLAYGLFIA